MSKRNKAVKGNANVSSIETAIGATVQSNGTLGVVASENPDAGAVTADESIGSEAPVQATPANTAIAATVAGKAVSAAKARYMGIASTHPHTRLQHEGATYAPKNKGALMAALWYAVCAYVGYTDVKKANAAILSVCAKLGAHAVTHCASKGAMLQGAEVSDAGAVGYARALKGALTGNVDQHSVRFAQYMRGGKYHDKAVAEQTLATLLITLHGSVEGIDNAKRATATASV